MQLLKNRNNAVYAFFVSVILAAGFFLRLYALPSYPLPINQDELSNIYDGYSIAETGADRWGNEYPLTLRGFGNGDYRPSLYAWLCAASIKVLGPTVLAGRLPAALLGCLSLLLLFGVARKIGGRQYAILALLLAALMPWHILYSRMAHEGLAFPAFFFILSCYLWIVTTEKPGNLVYLSLLGLSLGMGTSTCHAGKLLFFLFSLLVIVHLFILRKATLKSLSVLGVMLLAGALPQVITLATNNHQFMSRASNTVLPGSLTYGYINNLFDALYSNFSPHFLFFSYGEYNKHTVGRLLNVECLFFYIGLFYFYRQHKSIAPINPAWLLALLFVAIFPAALTDDNPHSIRASCLTVLLPLFSATGIILVKDSISNLSVKKIYFVATLAAIIINGAYFVKKYPVYAPSVLARHQNELVNLAKKIDGLKEQYHNIYIQDVGNQPYIYIAFYCHIKPQAFQNGYKDYEENAFDGNWDHFRQIGKFHFVQPDTINKMLTSTGREKNLFVIPTRYHHLQLLDSVWVEDKMFYFTSIQP